MLERELAVAVEAVRMAGTLCQQVRATLVTADTMTKKDKSPVTIADLGAQAVMSHVLHGAFPADPLMAEETADAMRDPANAELKNRVLEQVARVQPALTESQVLTAIDRGRHTGGNSGRFWTMDPIDGTKGFIRNDQYAIAVALIQDGQIVFGVLGCPALSAGPGQASGVIFAARKGFGATVAPIGGGPTRPLHVSDTQDPAQAVICQSVESGHTSHSRAERIAALLGATKPSVQLDSQAKYGVVARGDASIYMRLPSRTTVYEEMIWDHAAGALIVAEAGGRVTDTAGLPLDFSLGRTLRANKGIIATNGKIHDAVVGAVSTVLAEG